MSKRKADWLGDMTKFSNRLLMAIEVSSISQTELAKLSGINPTQINHFINSDREPTLRNLAKMMPHLKVNAAWLIGVNL